MKVLKRRTIRARYLDLPDLKIEIVEHHTLGVGREIYLIATDQKRFLMKPYKTYGGALKKLKAFRRVDLEKEGDERYET